MVCEPWDVVIVPFPFTERLGAKRRPALVMSKARFNENGHTLLSMITTKAHHPWPGDSELKEPGAAGLSAPCIVRLKLFTLDNRLILKRIGHLSNRDRRRVAAEIRLYFF